MGGNRRFPSISLTELVIAGGTVATADGPRQFDVHVSDGVITALEEHSTRHPAGARVVDAGGMYVLPGAIDVHVHGRDPGFPEKEDFSTLTMAAASGGVTTVIDMPNTIPGVDSGGVLESKAALAHSKAHVDFGLWGLIRSSSTADQLESLAQSGAIGFKAYLGYAFSLSRKQVQYSPESDDPDLEAPPDYGTLLRLAPVVAALGLPLVIHAEDPGILSAFRRPLETYADVLASRPPEAEAVAIAAAAAITDSFGARLHVAHLSSALGLRAAEMALRDGSRLSLETCVPVANRCRFRKARDFDEDVPAGPHGSRPTGFDRRRRQGGDRNRGDRPRTTHRRGEGKAARGSGRRESRCPNALSQLSRAGQAIG